MIPVRITAASNEWARAARRSGGVTIAEEGVAQAGWVEITGMSRGPLGATVSWELGSGKVPGQASTLLGSWWEPWKPVLHSNSSLCRNSQSILSGFISLMEAAVQGCSVGSSKDSGGSSQSRPRHSLTCSDVALVLGPQLRLGPVCG